ncbi:permease [Collibacillus ludicampi]|uniref:Permease n=1 Tax=Collibacillus ludicampi TaxID=2771369 RepID=A0AAV4LDT5_9BACL|nr:MFS transporter [Collibacillus ludicampi]GIM45864.1 permease [Collibacillus ludicampi]
MKVRLKVFDSNKKASIPSYRWIILAIATWAQASATFVTYGISPLSAIWQSEAGLTSTEVGLLLSSVQIGPILSMLLVGKALDQYGERLLIGLGSIFLGFTAFSIPFIQNYIGILFLLGAVGIWYGTAQPGGSKVVITWFEKQERGLAMGIRQAGIPIGGALAGALIPYISLHFGWQRAVYVQAILSILGGLLFLLMYRDPPKKLSKQKRKPYSFKEKLFMIMKNKQLLPLFITGVILVSLQMILVGHLMPYCINQLHLSVLRAGQALSVALLFGMAGRVILAWICDTFWGSHYRYSLQASIWASILAVTVLVFIPPGTPIWFFMFLCAWLGFFGIGWFSSFLLAVTEHASPGAEGLTVSYALTLNQFAIVLAPVLFGLVVDWHSYRIAWVSLDVLLIIAACLLGRRTS